MKPHILIWVALALLIPLGLSMCSVPTSRLDWIEQAEGQIEEGHYTAAETIYQCAMEDESKDAGPALHLAELYAEWKRPELGLTALDEAIARGAVSDLVTPLRSELLMQAGQWTQLRLESQKQISKSTGYADAWRTLTLAALHQGDCAAAIEAVLGWMSARSSPPEDAFYYLAVLSADSERLAVSAPDLYLVANTCDGTLEECLGYALIRQERWALAICPLRRANRVAPQDPNVHIWLGEVLSRNAMAVEAEFHLLEGVRLAPDDPLPWLLLGKHYLALGETKTARNPLLNAQALDPANPAPCLAITELKAQASTYDEMNTWADATLERALTDADIWKTVARLYLERHLIQDTYPLRASEGAVRLEPEDGEAHMLLGWTYLQLSQNQAALNALSESIELTPDSGESHFWLGQALKAAGEFQQAQEALTRAADLGYFPDR